MLLGVNVGFWASKAACTVMHKCTYHTHTIHTHTHTHTHTLIRTITTPHTITPPAHRFAATLGELTGGRVGLVAGSVGVLKVCV